MLSLVGNYMEGGHSWSPKLEIEAGVAPCLALGERHAPSAA